MHANEIQNLSLGNMKAVANCVVGFHQQSIGMSFENLIDDSSHFVSKRTISNVLNVRPVDDHHIITAGYQPSFKIDLP